MPAAASPSEAAGGGGRAGRERAAHRVAAVAGHALRARRGATAGICPGGWSPRRARGPSRWRTATAPSGGAAIPAAPAERRELRSGGELPTMPGDPPRQEGAMLRPGNGHRDRRSERGGAGAGGPRPLAHRERDIQHPAEPRPRLRTQPRRQPSGGGVREPGDAGLLHHQARRRSRRLFRAAQAKAERPSCFWEGGEPVAGIRASRLGNAARGECLRRPPPRAGAARHLVAARRGRLRDKPVLRGMREVAKIGIRASAGGLPAPQRLLSAR